MNNWNCIVRFLCSFFNVFDAYIIEVRIRKDEVEGVIMYTDDDMQRFVWHYSNLNHLKMATELLDILKQKEWISIDKIIVSEKELIKYLEEIGWNMDDINNVLFFLVSLNINMIDEGEETDMFFVLVILSFVGKEV